MKITKVLIADDIEKECVDLLQASGIEVTIQTKQSLDDLKVSLPAHDAVIVRSATKITKELIEAGAGGRLRLIGRAGTGVDNIDVVAATANRVLVMNTPQANSRSAAELTCILILSLTRHVPQADASMKAGKWARKDFMGEEVFGRTLAVLGLGRIGSEVAARLQAFGMRVIGYDPMITKEVQAAAKNIELLSLDEIWPQADFITVHVPLIPATENLINAETLAKCKKGVKIINVARGGIVNEQDLVDALNSGQAGGAAFDVFIEEPPKYRGLVEHPKAICTPHLGASTVDAQLRVATEIAENIVQLNNGNVLGVLNAKQVL
ncbi:putative phosphoglycerate dehydrogenase [Ancylostoma caninum]|uniref:D-3-phosphoglycerate dehydrogenase n=1 Tax=Ancylostoma caninum TaxID=29170 RepID=A0A368GY90_ANCCA|nr:putative phosphoglycerate dehydrogenase [Ancylostoma caninum]